MAVLVGIDEAGFGPILGPLVVSSSTFSVPRQLVKADLWHILRKSTANKRKHLAGRLLIADSKKAYSKTLGIKHLQRTVLACLRCLYKQPESLTELLSMVSAGSLERLQTYPWYKQVDEYHISTDEADMAIASAVLKNDLDSNGLELLTLHTCCLDVAYYNRMMDTVKNKASVLFTATSQLIMSAFDNFGRHELQIIVDRQGGRVRYRKSLQKMFPDTELAVLQESTSASSYQLKTKGKKMRLHFVVDADDRFLPVSLASMLSKYVRELLVDNINRYFARLHKSLRPTAGYWKDGMRFIQDLKTNLPNIEFDANQLIRCR
jgi:ribonuclease HII